MSKFVFSEKVFRALEAAYLTKRNVILWGPPGHAKSQIAEAFLKLKYKPEEIFPTVQMGIGTTPQDVFGPIDMKQLQTNGAKVYNTDKSFMAFKSVVFEETLDAPPPVLEMLKDPLMSKKFCGGNVDQCVTVRTEMIICCTNHDPLVWATTESRKAVLERFPFIVKVDWPSYTAADFLQMFKAVGKSEDIVMATISSKLMASNAVFSPRSAVQWLEVKEKMHDWAEILMHTLPEHAKKIVAEVQQQGKQRLELESIIGKLRQDEVALQQKLKAAKTMEDYRQVILITNNILGSHKLPAVNDKIADLVRSYADVQASLKRTAEAASKKLTDMYINAGQIKEDNYGLLD